VWHLQIEHQQRNGDGKDAGASGFQATGLFFDGPCSLFTAHSLSPLERRACQVSNFLHSITPYSITKNEPEPRWRRGWAVYSVSSGLLTLLSFAIFLTWPSSAIAGLIERLATSGVSRPFDFIVLVRVWLWAGFASPVLASRGLARR
jgi:hypothetical protein